MRLFLAMMSHETNTFSTISTDRAQFEARGLHYGGEIVETFRGTGTCLGRHDRGGRARGRDPGALGGGGGLARRPRHRRHLRASVKARILADLAAAGRLEGVLLDLHGAMVPEGMDDGEGDLIGPSARSSGPRCRSR